MRVAGVSEFIDEVDADVDRGIETDCVVAANNVVVDRSGHCNAGDPVKSEVAGSSERSVASDNDYSFNSERFAGVNRFHDLFFGLEFGATRTSEESAASSENIADISCGQFLNITFNKPLVAFADSHDRYVLGNTGSDDRANRGIHALSVAAARQYADCFHYFIIPFRYTEIIYRTLYTKKFQKSIQFNKNSNLSEKRVFSLYFKFFRHSGPPYARINFKYLCVN